MDQGYKAGSLFSASRSGGVPDVTEDPVIVESYQYLRGLIVGGGAPEISSGGELGYLPVPGEIRQLSGVNIHPALQSEGRPGTLQVQAGGVPLGTNREVRFAVVHLH